jgi:hypothetical protein
MIILMLLAGLAGCGSSSKDLPIPAQEANRINERIILAINNEIAEANDLLQQGDIYKNGDEDKDITMTITGLSVRDGDKATIHATLAMDSFEIGFGTYQITGNMEYDSESYENSNSTTTYRGTFTLTMGPEESYACRWPFLEQSTTLDPDTEQPRTQLRGSYIINGVTYSLSGGAGNSL